MPKSLSDQPSPLASETSKSCLANKNSLPDQLDLIDLFDGIIKRWKIIVKITCFMAIFSLGVSLLLDNVYRATALILPPQQDSGLLGMFMGATGGNLASLAGDILGKGTPADMYVGILNSDVIHDQIIDRFKLMDQYKEKYRITTYKVLKSKVNITAGKKDGIISITVEDKNPSQAAEIANAYVEELGNLLTKLNITDSGNNKLFLEQRLDKAKIELINAENNLKTFQTSNKILSVTDQALTSITGIAQLKAQLALQEVQLATLKRQFTDSSQEVKTAKASINNLLSQISRFEGNGRVSAIPNVGRVPELGQQYLRLMREFKIKETLVDLLTKNYEVEKLNSAKEFNTIQVVQAARTPDKKSWPKRAFIVATATTLSFVIALMIVLCATSLDYMNPERRERWNRLIKLRFAPNTLTK